MASKKNESTEIAKTNAGSLAVASERPDWMTVGSNLGSEEVTANDIILPRIDVLQALSPQLKKKDPKYIEGAEQGEIFNTMTGEIYGPEINFIPVKFAREFIIWQDRDAGGGFRGSFASEDEAEAERLSLDNPDLHEVVETHTHFVLIDGPNGLEEAVLSLAKSKRKVSRKLNSLVQMGQVDRFARVYKLAAVEVNGPKGEYWSFDVAPVGFVSREVYQRGKETYEAVQGGLRKVDRSDDDSAASESGSPVL